MQEKPQETHSHEDQAVTTSSPADSESAEISNRRELIRRYGKYALVASPLLLFASKAHAIHSKP